MSRVNDAANVVSAPGDTVVVRVVVVVACVVVCSDTGQLVSPDDRHDVPVYIIFVVVVTVVRSSSSSSGAAALAVTSAPSEVMVVVEVCPHTPGSVVYHSGMSVWGTGPQVCSPKTSVAPASAPRRSW